MAGKIQERLEVCDLGLIKLLWTTEAILNVKYLVGSKNLWNTSNKNIK